MARTVRAVYHPESKRVSLFLQLDDGSWVVADNVPRFIQSWKSAPAVQWTEDLFSASDVLAIGRELIRVGKEMEKVVTAVGKQAD